MTTMTGRIRSCHARDDGQAQCFAWFGQMVMAGALCRRIKVSNPGQVFAQ